MTPRLLLQAAGALLLLTAPPAHAAALTVFAASSLTDAFQEIGRTFDRQTGHRTTFQFAGSQVLRTQIEQGARPDVFASADDTQFVPLKQAGLIPAGQVFARNTLTVITPTRSTLRTLRDLARPGVKLVLADPAVPVGKYSRQLLRALDSAPGHGPAYSRMVLANVVSVETNVRQVALKVQLGEADAGIVYRTDLTPALKQAVRQLPVPPALNPVASYPIGVLGSSAQPAAAQAFTTFVRGPVGQAILRKWGFLSPR